MAEDIERSLKDPKPLAVWGKSHALTLDIYRLTGNYPQHEAFGLTSQTRRASSSIPANISEGCGRDGDTEFARFLQIAMGSACELEYHLLLAHDLHYLPHTEYEALAPKVTEIKRMLASLIKTVRSSKLTADR